MTALSLSQRSVCGAGHLQVYIENGGPGGGSADVPPHPGHAGRGGPDAGPQQPARLSHRYARPGQNCQEPFPRHLSILMALEAITCRKKHVWTLKKLRYLCHPMLF
jgi:hypothetical protein